MCPLAEPSYPAEVGQILNDEQSFLWLDQYTQGFSLPANVLADMGPFQYHPSNLQEGIWYLVDANEKKDSDIGLWKDKGEACKIYSNLSISGWRASLEYFEGHGPHGQRTDWLMHEHKITQKELCYKDKLKESRSLCKVFLYNASISENELCSCRNSKTVIESNPISMAASVIPDINITSVRDSKNEFVAKTEGDAGLFPFTDITSNFSQDFSELECVSRGDYLELNDLQDDPESNISSSQNSSCPSNLSEEYFDSLALLQDLEEEDSMKTKGNPSSSRFHFTHSVGSGDVIIQPPSSGSVPSLTGSTLVNEWLTVERRAPEITAKRHISDTRNEGPSNFSDSSPSPSSSHANASSDGEKKTSRSGRIKKLKQYFCFKPSLT